MKLEEYFKLFIKNISLNINRIEKIESAISTWEEIFQEDNEIGERFREFYTQGSFATTTAVRPNNGDEFDVDAVLLVEVEKGDSKDFFNWIVERMKTKEKYKGKIKPKDRCVRVNYAGDFHVDIVPAKSTYGDSIFIPSKKEGEWVKTNPKGFKKWFDRMNIQHDRKLSPIVRILKHWRDKNVGDKIAPKSILLTTLVGKYMVEKNSYAETLVATLENLNNKLEELMNNQKDDATLEVCNPSLEDENLARDWDINKCRVFKDKLKSLHKKALEALEEPNKEKSIEKWQGIFEKFPSQLIEEGAKMAELIASGSVYVNSQGELNISQQGTQIKKHRFFGEREDDEKI
ncbi:SMODS domain-containing nucleotidyltransferase [Thermoflavimicrobium daqui]|jgi:hypothetical protein|uniref:Nucleotidyltransferase n=1 Tax=Thermoflavimicrobium daqui TaxID=2137476 RepID=A0A364K8X0_9BACL|nr:nucleotidyltransferase [Thermoflavimicrobium daqui]RAL26741.1 nucleotidyltransferase [Thermoflavimicrobium daqui]